MKNFKFLNKSIFTIEDVKKEITSESTLFSTLRELQSNKIIKKIKGGLYAMINPLTGDMFANKFELATALHNDAFVGYHTALEFYGLGNQMYTDVQVFTPTQYKNDFIDDFRFVYFETNYVDGVLIVEQNSTVRVTELERTVIDCINRLEVAGGLEEVYMALSAITYCDENKLLYHLKTYNIKALYKKVGFLFSLLNPDYLTNEFYMLCKKNISNRFSDIRENKKTTGIYIDEWKLIIPKEIMNMEN